MNLIIPPKEKAAELVSKYNSWYLENLVDGLRIAQAKQCALIAIEELIINVNMCIPYHNDETYINYWQQVKAEIESLKN
jgi:hypothetical protein